MKKRAAKRAAMCATVLMATLIARARSESIPVAGTVDPKIRTAFFDPNQVYALYGYVGFHLDLEFAPEERFVGLSAGDPKALSYGAHGNVLTIRPKVAHDEMNLTVTTTAHRYYFDYTILPRPGRDDAPVMYAVRFTYPPPPASAKKPPRGERIDKDFARAEAARAKNTDYWYCGSPAIKPEAVYDDGIETHIRYGAREELPAIFVQRADGSESLLNFTVAGDEVVIHRVARRFVVRRGALTGCIVNKDFTGGGARLRSGTIAPDVIRERRGAPR